MFFRLWKVLQGSQAKLQNTETFLIQFNEQGSTQAGECQWKTIYVMEQKQAQEAGDVVMKKSRDLYSLDCGENASKKKLLS